LLLVIPLAHNFALILALTFCWAIVADATRPATMSALTSATSPEQRKAAIAVNRLAVNLGMSIGPAVGGLVATISFPLLFVVDGLTSLASALVLTLLLRSRGHALRPFAPSTLNSPARASSVNRGRSSMVWRDKRAMSFLFAILLISIVFQQNQGAMPLYIVRDLHYRESFYGLLFVVNTLLIVVLEVPLNLGMAHWPHRRALAIGMLLTAIGFGAMGLAHGVFAIVVTVIIWTFGEMITFPVGTAYVADIAPPGRNGEYMGAFSSTFSLAMVVGPWAGAAALDRFGPSLMWTGVFICGLIATGFITFSREPVMHVIDGHVAEELAS
jgi:MFS family permease